MFQFWVRIVFFIIAFVLQALFDGLARRDFRTQRNVLATRISVLIRRRKALKKCKKFLSKRNNTLTLKNSNVMFMCNTKEKTITCLNAKDYKQAVWLKWANQQKNYYEDTTDNTFERVFDNICASFDETSSYIGILKVLKINFDDIAEVKENSENNHNIKLQAPMNYNLININDASAENLANLPGINIAVAKKIVQRINLKGDYESIEQMFSEMKIKKHFQVRLGNFICAKPTEKKDKIKKNSDNENRIVDF